ncbi:MAG: hypothetical protein HYY67_05060 [Thaumarchaeota archaeon]|nr:hypothetical protein [Nitrososphaerota archaeon]
MAPRTKAIGIITAISLAALLFHTFPNSAASPCSLTGSLSGIVVRPPNTTSGPWDFSIAIAPSIKEVNGIVQGSLTGTFSATGLGIESSTVSGQWSYNKQTEKILIMLSGDGFRVDISILNLPSPGFTFSGILYVDGSRPAMLVKGEDSGSISCAVP